jgi:hypothetical protein
MARYDDYDDRRRRRDEDDDPDDYPRRPNDRSPAERDTLMQRRLRRARGEEIDDDDYYDEQPEPPRYTRARGGYAPSYNTGSAGGCAAATLYIVLGGIAVLILLMLFGRQLISGLVPNVPAQVRQIVATPTTTVRDRGGTILQIRSLNRLESQSFSVERVIEAKVERGNALDLFLSERLLLIASGNVVAGVDLSKLRESDVTISADGKSITLRLPPSEIFSKGLDSDRTRVYDKQTGIGTRIFGGENKDLETQARAQAETEILNAACEGQIMQKAADDAQRSMEQFLKLLDFEQVTVASSAGPCVAPAAAAPVQTPTGPTP